MRKKEDTGSVAQKPRTHYNNCAIGRKERTLLCRHDLVLSLPRWLW